MIPTGAVSSSPSKRLAAFLIGAGAVHNAWDPVLAAIRPSVGMEVTADGANSYLARVVFLLRWYATATSPSARETLRTHLEYVGYLKGEIASALRSAQSTGALRARRELVSVINAFLINYSRQFLVVSTNWDTVVDQKVIEHLGQLGGRNLSTLHVHGTAEDGASLFLPSEVTREPYRDPDEEQRIGRVQGTFWRALERASRVVIYGLSLSPLDAELCQNVAAGLSNPTLREIIIVNPEHDRVAHRVNLLLDPRFHVRVLGYHPDRLTSPVDYSVKRSFADIPEVLAAES